eukprot:gene11331-8056_t
MLERVGWLSLSASSTVRYLSSNRSVSQVYQVSSTIVLVAPKTPKATQVLPLTTAVDTTVAKLDADTEADVSPV